jgi:hypothetical protein
MTEYAYKVCPVCGIHYAVDKIVMDYKRSRSSNDKENGWSCPNGHGLVFKEYDADIQRRRAERAEQESARQQELRLAAERQAAAARGQVTRLKNRSKAGVCPCCNRTFKQLAAHMANKHPSFDPHEPLRVIEGGAA